MDQIFDISEDDQPFQAVLDAANRVIKSNPLANCYQKFTCQHCGNRLTMEEPNTFYTQGTCDQCNGLTDIQARGHNFMMVVGMPRGKHLGEA